ncbi:heterokaryon incompatibility protein [Colletotrichum musicola]|uniref:Heterokaryon incompatibility protein n=1 Tax=Colletotrichum musicola TaxID=2175873 RepID=A0A8H6MXR8_9PEZI|nr:heterokaryon incompatibility protein [Colletotrichum musicola]
MSLPRSFQYAVCLSRQLGIRYLWIDSLCILQDSRKDWVGESAQMGRVYGAAFCTVATSNDALDAYESLANDDVESLPSAPDDEDYLPQWVEVYVGQQSREKSRKVDKKYDEREGHIVRIFDSTPSDWESMLEESALSGRGWTLQERQLSRRVVHITRNAILWECRTCRGSEQVPWTDQVAANMRKEARYRIKDFNDNPRQPPRGVDAYQYKTWYDLVWDYSSRLLTVGADKMPGLAGLAKTMAEMVGDEYVAGLWKEDFISGLLWKSRRWPEEGEYEGQLILGRTIMPAPPGFYPGPSGPLKHSRPEQKRAPTWSWMGLDGPVVHWMGFQSVSYYDPELNDDSVITPREVVVEWDSCGHDRDPFSQAEGGRLTITGCLQPAKAKYPLRDLFLSNLDSSFWTEGYKTLHDPTEEELATPSCDQDGEGIADEIKVLRARGSHHNDQEIRDCMGVIQYDILDGDMVPNQTVYVLALRSVRWDVWETPYCIYTERDERGLSVDDQVFGLALVPTGEAENEYRRVGVAEFVPVSWFKEENRRTIVVI